MKRIFVVCGICSDGTRFNLGYTTTIKQAKKVANSFEKVRDNKSHKSHPMIWIWIISPSKNINEEKHLIAFDKRMRRA